MTGDAAHGASAWRHRQDFRQAEGVLLVLRAPPPPLPPAQGQPPSVPANPAEGLEVLLAVHASGRVTALAGHVDLGTGLRTAYAQIVAEELGLPLECIDVVLGDTARAPNQGPTIASTSIQLHAQPLRLAAAQALAWLLADAAALGGAAALGEAVALGGAAGPAPGASARGFGAQLAGRHVELMLDRNAPVKPPKDYTLVGSAAPRVDLPDKLTGAAVFVHDVRLPGMLHGRVVRPPYAGLDAGDFVGRSLIAAHEDSIAHIPGIVRLVVQGDFIGIVAQREEQAEAAMHALRVEWQAWPAPASLDDLAQALSAHPSTARVVAEQGDVQAARSAAAQTLDRDYVWPYQLHASIGPSCAVAQWRRQDPAESAARANPAPPHLTDESSSHGEWPPGTKLCVWAGTQNPHALRADLAKLTGLADVQIDVIRLEASGCYGRNGADDVAADAALLARAVGAPVRVQLSREQEHAWEPKGAAQLMRVRGGLMADGSPAAYDFDTSYPSNGAPTLALLLTRTVEPVAQAFEMGDRTAVPPYGYAHQRITINDMAPILRASWLRGVSALPNSFAHESYIDELASAAGVDPVAYRLRYLNDPRAAELVQATTAKAGWQVRAAPSPSALSAAAAAKTGATAMGTADAAGAADAGDDWLPGQGFAYARYVHSKFPGFGAAWAAWVANVLVHRITGEVQVRRVVVGHDAGLMINPAGVQHQVHGNVLQTTSRALKERVTTDPATGSVSNREWGSYPILNFRELPVVDVLLMPRPGEPALGAGESASVPGTAAIANAIFDATGVRLRQPPFTPEVVSAALHAAATAQRASSAAAPAGTQDAQALSDRSTGTLTGSPSDRDARSGAPLALPPKRIAPTSEPQRPRKPLWAIALGLVGAMLGLAAAAIGWRPAIAPVAVASAGLYSAATLERGRQLAALGNCATCHTAPGGAVNAGGLAMATPFGMVHSTNITPDAATGIGSWSFSAFQRAMREGVSRDGRHLYPAFPFTSFARMRDDELMALFAWLQTQPAVHAPAPANGLQFPFNLRPLMGLWNALHLQQPSAVLGAEQAQAPNAQWQRGAELVNGVAHCGACHTPRDRLGAELSRSAYLAGASVQGWEAPALGAASRSALPWTEDALVQYLRQGHSAQHGIAHGPMAAVVRGLAQVDEAELRAMAHYLVSLQTLPQTASPNPSVKTTAQTLLTQSQKQSQTLLGPAQRMFESACGACHHEGQGPAVLGLNLPLALSSKLHSARPDNLLRTILDGIQAPAFSHIGHMPAFGHALDDRQLTELAAYMRQRFAPGQPAWPGLTAAVGRARALEGAR